MTRNQQFLAIISAGAAVASAVAAWFNYSLISNSKEHSGLPEIGKQYNNETDAREIEATADALSGEILAQRRALFDVSRCKKNATVSATDASGRAVVSIAPFRAAKPVGWITKDSMVYVCEAKGEWTKILFEYYTECGGDPIYCLPDDNILQGTRPQEVPISFNAAGWIQRRKLQF